MAKDTRERILDAALEIFARDGYTGTNIKDIADAVGIVKSALYKHFESKEAIWEAVRDRVASYYAQQMGSPDRLPPVPQTAEELIAFTLHMVDFTVHDKRVATVRRLLMTEQFRDEKTRDCANEYFLYRTEALFAGVFSAMMEKGILRQCDPGLLAFAYTTPVTALIHLCDRDPAREAEAMEQLRAFLQLFITEWRETK